MVALLVFTGVLAAVLPLVWCDGLTSENNDQLNGAVKQQYGLDLEICKLHIIGTSL